MKKASKFIDALCISCMAMIAVGLVIVGLHSCVTAGEAQCAYCGKVIPHDADCVYCQNGDRYHCNCYMRFIREGDFKDEDCES